MIKKDAKKLIDLYKSGCKIFSFIETDDHVGWVMADSIEEENLFMTFDTVNTYIHLSDEHIFAHDFKVFNEVEDWYNK